MAAPDLLIQRKSGIQVPATAVTRRERVMARSKFLRLLRQMQFSRAYGLVARFECETCKQPVRMQHGAAILQTDGANNNINPKTDAFSLSCSCSVWTVK